MPCSIATYVVYGETIEANILSSVASGPATTIVSVLMTAHLLFGIVIVINPVSQQLEHVLNIPESKFSFLNKDFHTNHRGNDVCACGLRFVIILLM
jgi:amino acid permease